MIQQSIAILIILFFLIRLFGQKKEKKVTKSEFVLWFFFWICSIFVIVFIKKIDTIVSILGFSSSGIDVLLYLSIAILFYMQFRVRIKLEKTENEITRIVREVAINKNIKE